ncbi:uncharacterized protein G2W53_032519 [Senna tora]|uniref:Uncharacterized protein n=1 Tax=Senna tora TaxID=362788 RepID=A0A834SXP9_9FABA|nr:uncharacterized protein G2W53_032519 [Senna tora]
MKDIPRNDGFTVMKETPFNERKISWLRKDYHIKRNLVL